MDKKKSILIVDDYPILREELQSLLSTHQDFCVLGGAEDGLEAIEFVGKLQPDLVLMDISMPRMNGLDATRNIKKKWPETKILVFTVYHSYDTAAIKAGADGYILKDASRNELIQSIENIFPENQALGFNC
ncbi:MAG: response regulator transcription factor [Thermodesulfobacteriota bacterium]